MNAGNTIHPTAIIGPGVELGRDNVVSPYAVILGPCVIGNRNWIGPHASIGTPAQMRDGRHEAAWDAPSTSGQVVIGDGNVIREFVTVHQATARSTRIGNDCYLMSYAHVPHDATIADGATLSNAVQLGGHTVVGPAANIGLGAMVHQRIAIGGGAMVGMGSIVTKDVLPFTVVYGNPARPAGINTVGLQRQGYAEDVVARVGRYLSEGADAPLPDLPTAVVEIFNAHRLATQPRS